ncbi:NAD(P)-dependent oxidoreductase [Candidatus Daviesbacteria bacterium]|nr:NAD(P)-dependent oxidoreductase [Candidatus Daviesbacteria bacterium]
MNRVIITGATGFIGKNLVENLNSKNFIVSIFDRKKHDLFQINSLKDLLKGQDVIVHLAGVNKDGSLKDILRVNILGTKKLLDAALKYCPNAKFIFASSSQVYDEDDVSGLSKLIAEELIKDYVKNKLLKGAIILRFSNIFGKGSKPFTNSALSTFAYLIKEGREITINGIGEQTRDFLYIDDAINAIIRAIDFDPKGIETFDICTGKLTSINQLIQKLMQILKIKVPIRYNRGNQSIKKVLKNYQKAKKILGWQPVILLEEGLRQFIEKI